MELCSPAGSFASLTAALEAGADSIYFGIDRLNMRKRGAQNFTLSEMQEVVDRCHKKGVKAYLTLNSIVYDNEMKDLEEICATAPVDAIIASDLAAITMAGKYGLSVHISTQANVSNLESLRFFSRFADVIVLARELTLEQIAYLARKIREERICGPNKELLKLELFVHGALCVAISGKCYMSLAQYNASANRGECLQACRRKYRIMEENSDLELEIANKFVMSPKDLCTIAFLDQIVGSGISILKIEGRARSADYVKTTTSIYKEALTAIQNNRYTGEKIAYFENELKKVYNRGFFPGYYLGKTHDEWSNAQGSVATKTKVYIGKITNFFPKVSVAECLMEGIDLPNNFKALIIGPTTGCIEVEIEDIKYHSPRVATFAVPRRVRKNDQFFLIKSFSSSNALL